MTKKNRAAVIALGIVSLFSSCAKEGPTGPTGPSGPSYTGSIDGHVSLYDKYGNKVLTGLRSVSISLSSTNVANPNATAINPDAAGAYLYNNVITGQYNIAATDSAYAATLLSFQYLSGTTNKDIKLSAIPDSFLTTFTATHHPGSIYDSLVVTVNPEPAPRSFIVFLNNIPTVSNFTYYYMLSFAGTIPAYATSATILVSQKALNDAGFADNAMVYYAAYSYVVNDASVYEDAASGKNVYNAVNTTPIIDSATAP